MGNWGGKKEEKKDIILINSSKTTFLCFVDLVLWKHAASVLLAREVLLFSLVQSEIQIVFIWYDMMPYRYAQGANVCGEHQHNADLIHL